MKSLPLQQTTHIEAVKDEVINWNKNIKISLSLYILQNMLPV